MHWPSFFSWKIETVLFFLCGERKERFQKTPPVCVERRQLPLGRGGLVSLNVYVVIDMVDAIAVVAIAL